MDVPNSYSVAEVTQGSFNIPSDIRKEWNTVSDELNSELDDRIMVV